MKLTKKVKVQFDTRFWSIFYNGKLVFVILKIATTPASEVDGEGSRPDLEGSVAPMDTDAANDSPEDQQKETPDSDGGQEPGQIDEPETEPEAEPDQEPDTGMIDGEIDAVVDTNATS